MRLENRKRKIFSINSIAYNGSVTVEASLVFPIFFFTICLFYSFFLILSVQTIIGESLVQTGRYVSQYGAIKEMDESFLKLEFHKNLMVNHLNRSCVQGGRLGVRFVCEKSGAREENLELSAVYRIRFPINIFYFKSIPVEQKIRTRLFIGKKMNHTGKDFEEEEQKEWEDRIVYITEHGTVYHKNKSCSHLRLTIKAIPKTVLEYARNLEGGKYKCCEKCGNRKKNGDLLFITLEGNRYHTSLDCSGLKRTIMKVKLSTVKDWNSCLRCG